jgi:CDP-paratose 2-epimerase
MRLLITGICGFVGSTLALALREAGLDWEICGLDNLIRPGSEENRKTLKNLGVKVFYGDIRAASDFESLPPCDWVLDAAANPSVLAGVDGLTSSRQLVEHNLLGTINLLECCKRWKAGFILLSTSRVYSIPPLAGLPVEVCNAAYRPVFPTASGQLPTAVSANGITEAFSTAAPISLYGSTKLCSEALALEYGATFDLPVWINRCGVLAGAGQFGRADQGIFSFWIHSHRQRRPLKYIGFDGLGHQVRDCLHPRDLTPLLLKQMGLGSVPRSLSNSSCLHRIINVSGGLASAMSLCQLTAWCDDRFGTHPVASRAEPRPFDLPWVVLDHQLASQLWDWQPKTPVGGILEEIAAQAETRSDWLEVSNSS